LILAQPELERFYNPACFRFARNELEISHGGEWLRFDRAVRFDVEMWILDYKRDLLAGERAAYEAQLARYRRAAQTLFPGLCIRTALITADGRLWPLD